MNRVRVIKINQNPELIIRKYHSDDKTVFMYGIYVRILADTPRV